MKPKFIGRKEVLVVLVLSVYLIPVSDSGRCFAYLYPEHRRITLIAIHDLSNSRAALLDRLWVDARTEYETRLSSHPADTLFTDTSGTVDYAAWPAIAGDHSCSSSEMLRTILESDWITKVSHAAARLGEKLEDAGEEKFLRTNAQRSSDLELLGVDPQMASRAGSNNAHFLLPRAAPNTNMQSYLVECLRQGDDINGIGIYAWYHHSALSKARRLSQGSLSEDARLNLIRSILADEAFALHFLEDAFAAGHVAGSWGKASLRKGTHDYYNEAGLTVSSWKGESFVLLGDAWMRQQDARRAATAVRKSLEQMLDAVSGHYADMLADGNATLLPDTLNVCNDNFMPSNDLNGMFTSMLTEVLEDTPIPGLATGYGEMPRFNAELGPFIGLTSGTDIAAHKGGFLAYQHGVGFIGGVELALRLGLGLDGVMNQSGDGLVFLDVGLARESATTLKLRESPGLDELGAITSVIPSRSTVIGRLRIPFYVIPFDLLLAAPVLWFSSRDVFTQMAVVASNGGLLGWQAGIATPIGRFQFVAGREVGIYFYGFDKSNQRTFAYPEDRTDQLYLLDVKSFRLLFPIIEYRNFRIFAREQSSAFNIQLYTGVDIPTSVTIVAPPNIPTPKYRSIWHLGLRACLDWRYYF